MKYAPSVGVKFHEDGSVRTFPGNTFICHVDKSSPLIEELTWAQEQLKEMKCGQKFSYLPISSMHMTVFESLCDQIRKVEKWSSKHTLDSHIQDTTDGINHALEDLPAHGGFEMIFDSVFNCPIGGSAIRIKPANEPSKLALQECREALSQVTGIRHTDFDNYHFHITLSYRVVELDDEDKQELETVTKKISKRISETFNTLTHGPVEFCSFDNMFNFKLIRLLD